MSNKMKHTRTFISAAALLTAGIMAMSSAAFAEQAVAAGTIEKTNAYHAEDTGMVAAFHVAATPDEEDVVYNMSAGDTEVLNYGFQVTSSSEMVVAYSVTVTGLPESMTVTLNNGQDVQVADESGKVVFLNVGELALFSDSAPVMLGFEASKVTSVGTFAPKIIVDFVQVD